MHAIFKTIPFIIFFILSLPLRVSGQEPSLIDVIERSKPALVTVTSTVAVGEQKPYGMARDPKTGRIVVIRNVKAATFTRVGAGVIIHPMGVIVTNAHNVNQANQVKVTLQEGIEFSAQIVQFVNDLDIALLKISLSGPIQFIEIADSDELKLGQDVITVGNSDFLKQTVSGGRIKGLGTNRTLKQSGKQRTDLIQTSINLYKGDSGGPLFDRQGRLIGLMTAGEDATDHSSFAIPSNKVKSYLDDYILNLKTK